MYRRAMVGLVPTASPVEAYDRLMSRIRHLGYADPDRDVIKNVAFECRAEKSAITTDRLVELTRGVLRRSRYVEPTAATEDAPARTGSMPADALANFIHHSVLGADIVHVPQDLAYANGPAHARIAQSSSTNDISI